MSGVFIMINEWTDEDEDQDYEVVFGDRFWVSEAEALVALNQIADELNSVVPDGETSFDAGDGRLERDIYYIRELTRG